AFADSGFETPTAPTNSYMAFPANTGWTVLGTGASGIITKGYMVSAGYPTTVEGVQLGYYATTSGLRQQLSLGVGYYAITFLAMGNTSYPNTSVAVSMNGVQQGSWPITSAVWGTYTVVVQTTSAGLYTFDFTGSRALAAGYVYIDNVRIAPTTGPTATFV